MRRREFIATLGNAAVGWSITAAAQQGQMPVIGFLNGASAQGYAQAAATFRQGLKEAGYVESQNVTIEYRWADGHYDRLPAMATELVNRRVTVIVANTEAAIAAKVATTTIPIVFISGTDPVKAGLVASLARPEGNLTGVSNFNDLLGAKQLEFVRELLPQASVIAVLLKPNHPNADAYAREVKAAADQIGQQVHFLNANTEDEIATAFVNAVELHAKALVIFSDPIFTSQASQLATLAARYAIPTIYPFREFPEAGGLMSYGSSIADDYRQLGIYAGRILHGAKPADLPVQQVVKVELIINLKTAKALGLTVPQTLLGRADEVIE